jgi:hypothetical protein
VNIPDAFTQLRDSIYWLDISVSSQQPLGWKTADQDRYPPPYTGQHFEDDAVWGELPEPYWEELRYPAGPDSGLSIDLAFVITGDTTMAGLPDGKENRRGGFKLGRAYPNPFSLSTTVRYEVRRKSQVFLAVYNVMGERVRILVNDEQAAGWHTATWDGRNGSGYMVASGIYFVQMKAKHFTGTSKLIFLN